MSLDLRQIPPESVAGWALLISILSLAWGILSYLLNRRRATRAYNAANIPALECKLQRRKARKQEIRGRVHAFWGQTTVIVAGMDAICTWLGFQLDNLSTSIAVRNIELSIQFDQPRKGIAKLLPKNRISFYSVKYSDLEPKENISHHPARRLEMFLIEQMPDVLQVRDGYESQDGYYEVLRLEPLRVIMSVGYRPGVTGTKPQKITKYYKLVPQLGHSENDSKTLYGWKLEEKAGPLWLRVLNKA